MCTWKVLKGQLEVLAINKNNIKHFVLTGEEYITFRGMPALRGVDCKLLFTVSHTLPSVVCCHIYILGLHGGRLSL